MRLLAFLLFFGLHAFGQQSEKKEHSINPKARRLNDSAVAVVRRSHDFEKAILLLDEATAIDSNYLTAFSNKLTFQYQTKQFDKALITAKSLHRIMPDAASYIMMLGVIYEEKGDTVSSKKYFNEAAKRYDNMLDTMNKTNKSYEALLFSKALNLILLGQEQSGHDILKQLYDNQKDTAYKNLLGLFMNKPRREILDNFTQRK